MPRFKKWVSTLDSNKKLTTFKGITVTKGFVEGTMSLDETAVYLESLGISGIFENLLLKSVFVPPGWRAEHTKSNKVYEQGMFIPVPERSWEDFVSAAQSDRGELWRITEVGITSDFSDPQSEVQEKDYDSAVSRLAKEYDEQDLGILFRRMQQQIEQIDDEGARNQAMEELESFISDVHEMNTLQLEKAKDKAFLKAGVTLDQKNKTLDLIKKLDKSVTAKVNKKVKSIDISFAPSSTAGAHPPIHLGAFISVLEISGNVGAIQHMSGLINASATSISVPVSLMFPEGLSTQKEKSLYRDMISGLNPGQSEDALAIAAAKLGHDFDRMYTESKVTRSKISRDTVEVLEKRAAELEKNIDNVVQSLQGVNSTSSNTVLEALNTANFAKATRQFHRSLVSGNLAVQTFFDAADELLDGNVNAVASLFDSHYDFTKSLDGKTLSEFVKDNPDNYRGELKKALFVSPPTPRAFGSANKYEAISKVGSEVRALFKSRMASADTYKQGAAYNIFMNSDVLSEVNKVVSSEGDREELTRALTTAFAAFADGPTIFRVKTNFTQPYADAIVASALATYEKNTGKTLPKTATSELSRVLWDTNKKKLGTYFKTRDSFSKAEEGPASSVVSDDVKEGLAALFIHGIYTSLPSSPSVDSDYDSAFRASAAISYFMGGNVSSVDLKTGGYVYSGEGDNKYLHLRILSSARFLPPMTAGGYKWPEQAKSYLDRMIVEKNPSLDINSLNDRDRLSYIAGMGNKDTIKPIFLALCNMTSSLQNVTSDDTSRSGVMLTRRKYEEMLGVMDTDLSASNVDRMRGVHMHTRELLGSSSASVDMAERFFLGDVDVSSPEFSDISLTSLVDHIAPKDGKLGNGKTDSERRTFVRNAQGLLEHRLSGKLPPKLIDHFKAQLETTALTGSTKSGAVSKGNLGHAYEFLANIPVLAQHLGPDSQVNILTPAPTDRFTYDAMIGFNWQDSDGNTHTLGKTNGSNSGLMDNVHLTLSSDGREISVNGYEAKLHENGGAVAHLGNSTNLQRLIIDYYARNPGVKSIKFGDIATINAPWAPRSEKETSCASTEMRLYGGRKYVAAGVCPDSGEMVHGDYKVPTL